MNSSLFPAAFAGTMLIIVGCVLVVSLSILSCICWLLMGCFERIPLAHRKMEPGLVWLLMIPCFNIVWNFFVYLRLSESYKAYFAAVGRDDGSDYGRGLGLAYAICAVCGIIPYLGILASLASLVLLIILLVKLTGYKNLIPAGVPGDATPPPPPSA